MPRRQPPKGYYTATEVKKILNISDAMIRTHVQKGKIHYFLPDGRKQGYYLKRDVDKLANELNAFFNLEETAPSKFMKATEKDIPAVVEIVKTLFTTDENASHVTPSDKYILWLQKNPNIIYVLKQDNQVIGFAITLPLKPDSDKMQEILRADLLGEVDIASKDVEEYKKGNHIQLYVVGIGTKPNIDKDKRRLYGASLISGLIDAVIEIGRKGVIIEKILAVGATHNGIRLLQAFGFSEMLPPAPGKRAFIIKIDESGAPVSLQYKQALAESDQN